MSMLLLGRKFAADGTYLAASALVRQTDSGRWEVVLDNLQDGAWNLRALTVGNEKFLYFIDAPFASSRMRGTLYESVDAGASWQQVAIPRYVMDIAVSANGTLWLIADDRQDPANTSTSGASYVYRSTDYGQTWEQVTRVTTKVSLGRGPQAANIACHPSDPNIVVVEYVNLTGSPPWQVGIWRTLDGGASWQDVTPSWGGRTAVDVSVVSHAFGYSASGLLLLVARSYGVVSATLFASSDNGQNWQVLRDDNSGSHANQVEDGCGWVWVCVAEQIWRLERDGTNIVVAADNTNEVNRFRASVFCENGTVVSAWGPGVLTGTENRIPVWRRRADLSDAWQEATGSMAQDLGFRVYPLTRGVLGTVAVQAEPTPPPVAPGEPVNEAPCIPIISAEVLVDGTSVYSRARAFGLGLSNADGLSTAHNRERETRWAPEDGHFLVQREIQANDYGVTERGELKNLADSFLVDPSARFKGYTVVRITVPSLPTSENPDMAGKILQAGDTIVINSGFIPAGVAQGDQWIVDSYTYYWPEDVTEIVASQRSAALAEGPGGNVRVLGMAGAGEGEYWESEWIPSMPAPAQRGAANCVQLQHNLGVVPSRILVIGADAPIENWYDDQEVDAKNVVVVPPLYYDPDWHWVGYRVVQSDGYALVLAVAVTLLVTEDGPIFSSDKFLKVFLFP